MLARGGGHGAVITPVGDGDKSVLDHAVKHYTLPSAERTRRRDEAAGAVGAERSQRFVSPPHSLPENEEVLPIITLPP